jgi:hypothetical protein
VHNLSVAAAASGRRSADLQGAPWRRSQHELLLLTAMGGSGCPALFAVCGHALLTNGRMGHEGDFS